MIEFTDDLRTHVEAIDDQHQELISRVNAIVVLGLNAAPAELQKTFDFLGEYVVEHFHDEEQLQIRSNYPKYRQHLLEHQHFVKDFAKLILQYENKGISPKFSQQFIDFVVDWVMKHIKISDADLAKHILKHPAAE